MLTASQFMTDHLATVGPESSIGRAVEKMLEENAGILLVVDRQQQLVGLVPDSVLLRAAMDSHLRHDPVSLHMSRQFMSVESQAPLETVIDQFILHRLQYLPVVDKGKVIGVISRQDLLRAAFSSPSVAFRAFSA